MTTRIVYTAELDHRSFLAGVRGVEGGAQRLVNSQQRVDGAFRSLGRGSHGDVTRLGFAVGRAAGHMRDLGGAAFDAGRKITGALSGGPSTLSRYAALGSLVTGILGGVAAKLTVIDSAKFDSTIGRAALQSGASP